MEGYVGGFLFFQRRGLHLPVRPCGSDVLDDRLSYCFFSQSGLRLGLTTSRPSIAKKICSDS